MKITICEDERIYAEAMEAAISRWMSERGVSVTVSTYRSSEDLLNEIEQEIPDDLVFLDIQFPGEMNGMQLAQRIRQRNEQTVIVFTTNYQEYAIEGYRVNALRYLQKPVADEAVFECLDIAYHQWSLLHDVFLIFESGRSTHKISYRSIRYIESKAHYIEVHTVRSGEVIELRCKLGDFQKRLPEAMFVRCHRSFIVNLLYVQSFSKTEIVLSGQERLPMSVRYREGLLNAFRHFFQQQVR